jgi:hypothetical protein
MYEGWLGFNNFDYFPALVFAAMRTGAVSANFFVTVRAFRHLRDAQRIVGPPSRSAPL